VMHRSLQVPGRARPSARAFSLLEMLIVIGIIGLIAALVLPRIAAGFGKGQVKTTQAQLELLTTATEGFKLDIGRYPTEQEGLLVLVEKPADPIAAAKWKAPYLQKKTIPMDGWGRPFVYKLDPTFGFEIKSLGADGKEGGEGENADLSNRE